MSSKNAATQAFDRQRRNAKRRGIPFLLTFEEWWDWWQTDGRWLNRGSKSSNFQMARIGDAGPYALGNIYCSVARDNWLLGPNKPRAIVASTIETRRRMDDFAHLRNRATHPRCRAVVSPRGIFPSIALAAEANGLTTHYAQKLASRAVKGWRYA
jgi:hypothetical protein